MNENKHPYSLGHRKMKRDHKDEKGCHAIQDSVKGKNLGKGGHEGMRNGGCGNTRVLKTLIRIGHLLQIFERLSIKINY
jgi:hypothetical protein